VPRRNNRLAAHPFAGASRPDRHEGRLNPARLAVLADALEDAGCGDAELLGHLRGPGVHVRGCWVVDLLIRKPHAPDRPDAGPTMRES
jgi:hypothetical protein